MRRREESLVLQASHQDGAIPLITCKELENWLNGHGVGVSEQEFPNCVVADCKTKRKKSGLGEINLWRLFRAS